MLISKPMPVSSITLHHPPMGAGDWQFAGPPTNLIDGRPRDVCRLFGPDPVDAPQIQINFARAIAPRLFAILSRGPSSASPTMEVTGRVPGSADFDVVLVPALAAPFIELVDGTLSAFYVSANATQVDAVRFRYGPVEDTGLATSFIDLGQLVAAEVFEFRASRDWYEERIDPSTVNVTRGSQPYQGRSGVSYRSASVAVTPVGFDRTIAGGDSLQALQASLAGRRPVCVVPMPRGIGQGEGSAINQEAVTRSALFGYCDSLGKIQLVDRSNLFQLALGFKEAPG